MARRDLVPTIERSGWWRSPPATWDGWRPDGTRYHFVANFSGAVPRIPFGFLDLARAKEDPGNGSEHLAAARSRVDRARAPEGDNAPLIAIDTDIHLAVQLVENALREADR